MLQHGADHKNTKPFHVQRYVGLFSQIFWPRGCAILCIVPRGSESTLGSRSPFGIHLVVLRASARGLNRTKTYLLGSGPSCFAIVQLRHGALASLLKLPQPKRRPGAKLEVGHFSPNMLQNSNQTAMYPQGMTAPGQSSHAAMAYGMQGDRAMRQGQGYMLQHVGMQMAPDGTPMIMPYAMDGSPKNLRGIDAWDARGASC